jgi:hypothetical protein
MACQSFLRVWVASRRSRELFYLLLAVGLLPSCVFIVFVVYGSTSTGYRHAKVYHLCQLPEVSCVAYS